MSSPLSEQFIEDFLESNFQANCLTYASAALLAYYVTLNLPHDVRCLWGRRSIATLVSLMNWLVIAGDIIAFGPLPRNTGPTRCEDGGYASEMLYIVTVAISPLVAALRVHAVSGGNWRLVLPVWLLGMVPVGTNIVGTWRITKFVPLNQDHQSGAQPKIPSLYFLHLDVGYHQSNIHRCLGHSCSWSDLVLHQPHELCEDTARA
ncbi:hypothetical protein IEO21_05380 [Rhodonia placenta]|uniref:Uncharacterized protein n=1 Tax=Rhodonia placenta TaxID=104341 RepID=A0A8H7U1K7_9APHY|nr:hypothetical protein IEO21_05380 [Postia placenta]